MNLFTTFTNIPAGLLSRFVIAVALTSVSFFPTGRTLGAIVIQDDVPATSSDSNNNTAPGTDVPAGNTGPKGATAADFPAQVDIATMKSGRILIGNVVREVSATDPGMSRSGWIFQTRSGGLMTLTSRTVKQIRRADSSYANVIFQMDPDSANDHWLVIKWCEEQENRRFKDEIDFHLRRICELDANDNVARQRRGLKRDPVSGSWEIEEKRFNTHGYAKAERGGFVPHEFLAILEYERATEKEYDARRIAYDDWLRAFRRNPRQTSAAQEALFQITDETAVAVFFEKARDSRNELIRSMVIESIARIPSGTAANGLVYFAIADISPAIRDRALTLLMQDHYDPNSVAWKAANSYLPYSKLLVDNKDFPILNVHVNRAAHLIRQMGSSGPVLNLIEGLTTLHTPAPAAGSQGPGGISFGSDSLGGTGLNAGETPKPQRRPVTNENVLAALRDITGESGSYDKDAWRRWYTENRTISSIDLRRDE